MNYYKQIAEMLGLELGQEFRIIGSHEKTIDDALFEITEDGLFSKANNLSGKVTLMLDLLLSGKTNRLVMLKDGKISDIDLFEAVKFGNRPVEKDSELLDTAKKLGIYVGTEYIGDQK